MPYQCNFAWISASKGPFSNDIFVALLYATFVVPEFHDENRKCKLAAISMRFVAAMLWKITVEKSRTVHILTG